MISICAAAPGAASQKSGTTYFPRDIQPNECRRSRHRYLGEPSKDAFNNPTGLGGCSQNHLPRCVFIAFYSVSIGLPMEEVEIDSGCARKASEFMS